jgi:hypothetical protein
MKADHSAVAPLQGSVVAGPGDAATAWGAPVRIGADRFLQGLLQPSLAAVVTALCVIATCFGLACFLIRPDMLGPDGIRRFALNAVDDEAFVSARLLELAQAGTTQPLVAILGASAVRESFVSEQETAAAIRSATGLDVEVALLAAAGQLSWQSRAIVEHLPRDRPLIVVLGVGPLKLLPPLERLAGLRKDGDYAFRSNALDDEFRRASMRPPVRTGIYLIDVAPFYVKKLRSFFSNALSGSVPVPAERRYAAGGYGADDARDYESQTALLKHHFDEYYEEMAAQHLAVIDRLTHDVAAHDGRLLLFETPLNPRFVEGELGAAKAAEVRGRLRAFARARGIPFVDLGANARLQPADFADVTHLSSAAAQNRMRRELAATIEQLLGASWRGRKEHGA